MEEGKSAEEVWQKIKTEDRGDLFTEDMATGSVDGNSQTSLADIFDTAFTSTADPSPQRCPAGNLNYLDS